MATTKNGIYYPNNYDTVADVPADLKKMAESIDAIVKEESEKNSAQGTKIANLEADNEINKSKISANEQSIGILQQKDETHDTDIEELQLENERLQERVELQEENMLSGKETGETVNLPESADYFCEVKVQGNRKQKTREGKNIFDKSSNPVINSKNIKTEETDTGLTLECTQNVNYAYNLYKLLDVTKYVGKIARMKTTILPLTEDSNPQYSIGLCNDDGSNRRLKVSSNISDQEISFEIKADEVVNYSYLAVWLYGKTGDTDLGGGGATYNNIIVTIDNEDMTYEPHGVMPSIKYPAKIKNVTDDIDITVCNENQLSYNDNLTSRTINGVMYTINEDGSITANGTATANATLNIVGGANDYPLKLKEGDYVLSGCEGGSGSTYYIEIYDGKTYRACQYGNAAVNFAEDTAIRAYITVKSGVTVNNVTFYPMLIRGTQAKEYIKNEHQKVIFPLEEGQVLHKGDYLAEDGIHHKRKTVVLNGTENWVVVTGTYNLFRLPVTGKTTTSDIMCDKLKKAQIVSSTNNYGIDGDSDATGIRVRTEETASMTLEEFKTWLASNNLTVEYELAQEEIEEYTEGQKQAYKQITELKTYKGESNAYTNTIAILDVEYKKDLETVINNLQATILASEEV